MQADHRPRFLNAVNLAALVVDRRGPCLGSAAGHHITGRHAESAWAAYDADVAKRKALAEAIQRAGD